MVSRPNVVLFISDQQRADTMPGETSVRAHTPHLAWLMERATTFRNAFCTAPICTPARASILTGLYPHSNGIMANYETCPRNLSVPDHFRTIADFLKCEGYECAYTGKWHLPTGDDRCGFVDFVTRLSRWDVDSEESDDAIRFGRRVGIELGDTYTSYLNTQSADSPISGGASAWASARRSQAS